MEAPGTGEIGDGRGEIGEGHKGRGGTGVREDMYGRKREEREEKGRKRIIRGRIHRVGSC